MYEEKTLVGIGCSHVFGEYMSDINPETCHQRSWVKKLEKLGNFKNSVNLGAPGGSNARSERVLLEYLKNNDTTNLVVLFSITELSRIEFLYQTQSTSDFLKIGSWSTADSSELPFNIKEFIKTYYMHFHEDSNDVDAINKKVLLIHTLMKSLNIEHYFFEMMPAPGTIIKEQFSFSIPVITFEDSFGSLVNASAYLTINGKLPGTCRHWDHDGNELLANYLLKRIKK